MKRAIFSVLIVGLVMIGAAGPGPSPSQAVPLGGPCDTAADYNWMYQFWNRACELYMMDYSCIVYGENCPD